MTSLLEPYDVTRENDMSQPLDYNRPSRLKHVDKVFKSEIINIIKLTEMEKLFQVRIIDDNDRARFSFLPGQFVMLEVPGYGEIPISISSSPSNKGFIELCIRKSGTVTGILHKARRGALIGLRGPFGTSFPMTKMAGGDILLIAGGLGLAPLRAPIFNVIENRSSFGQVHILYGTKHSRNLLFTYQYEEWNRIADLNLKVIVEQASSDWHGPVGMITELLAEVDIDPGRTNAIICGPPVMFKFVCSRLMDVGVSMNHMFVSLERRMHCGMGKCCRCNIGSTYTCKDGPVFDYWTVMNLKEAI